MSRDARSVEHNQIRCRRTSSHKKFASNAGGGEMDKNRDTRRAKLDRRAMKRNGERESRDLIRDNLRRVYGEVAAEPLPSALLDLLKKLDEPEDPS